MTAEPQKPLLSICIPARNEEENIGRSIDTIRAELEAKGVPFEFVIANDNSSDGTERVVREKMQQGVPIRLINRRPPGGFGRAIRSCLDHFRGDIVVVGKGNRLSLCSSPHGAGREYSRHAARRAFTQDDLRAAMDGIEYRDTDAFIDEIPFAYKDIDVVMRDAEELVEVRHTLRQVVNVKGD